MDCQWVEDHLEAIFCDGLAEEEDWRARAHIESCGTCRKEVQALIAIDPVIKRYFRTQLAKAVRSTDAPTFAAATRPRWILQSAAVALAAIVLVLMFRTPQADRVEPRAPAGTAIVPSASLDAPPVNKNDVAVQPERAKPSPDTIDAREPAGPSAALPAAAVANAPAFLVSDAAGYSHSLQDYRGSKTLIGVWSPDKPESYAMFERLYKTFGSEPKLRFLGVSPHRARKPPNTTFPVFSNQGSRLLDAKPGQFVLVNEDGVVTLRGLLVEDFEVLSKTLRAENQIQ